MTFIVAVSSSLIHCFVRRSFGSCVLSVFVWNIVISPFIEVLSCYKAIDDVELLMTVNYMSIIVLCYINKEFYRL